MKIDAQAWQKAMRKRVFTDTTIDQIKSLMTTIAGSAYDKGRCHVFKDDVNNLKFHSWLEERINSLLDVGRVTREIEFTEEGMDIYEVVGSTRSCRIRRRTH